MTNQLLVQQGVERRAEILAFIRSYQAAAGYAPSFAEITQGVGLTSGSGTRKHLLKLCDEGYLRMAPKSARAIALISPAPDGWTRD